MRRVIEAVPGAGKTALLLELTEQVPSLLLAYNKQLARSISERVGVRSLCVTFHSLCTRCLGIARDDLELLEAVERAERGEITPVDVPPHRRVLVDEAQDVRELYVRLLRVLGLTSRELVVVGDSNQLVYDFDDAFPASLRTLRDPEAAFGGGAFERERRVRSHRLTACMTALVNHVFELDIETERTGPRVEVRAPKSMYSGLYECLRDLLKEDILLLVDRKQGHRALRTLLNRASRAGGSVSVHGVDEEEDSATRIECGTYWSAKGLQRDTVVVLLPGRAPRNATYVALTRATTRLVVVLDPRDPHPLVSRAVVQAPQYFTVVDKYARDAVVRGFEEDGGAAGAFGRRGPRADGEFVCLDRAIPLPSTYVSNVERCDAPQPRGRLDVIVQMALVACEYAASGVVRAMEDILHPTRLDAGAERAAIRAGLSSRAVPVFVSDDELLAADLRDLAATSYARMESLVDIAHVALATLAWDSWDHVMRASLPVDWIDDAANEAIRFVRDAVPSGAHFDVRLTGASGHARTHFVSDDGAYHVCWGASTTSVAHAAQRAALHPSGRCVFVDAGAHRVGLVVSSQPGQ